MSLSLKRIHSNALLVLCLPMKLDAGLIRQVPALSRFSTGGIR